MKAHTPSQICSEGASLRPSGSLSVSQCLCTGLSFKIYSKRKERACHMFSSAPRTTGHSQNTHGRNKLCSWHCTLERQQKLCLGWGGGDGNIGTGRTVNLIDGHFQTIVAKGVWKSVTTILQTQSHLTEARQTKTSAWQYLATGPCSGMTHGR